MINFEYMKSAMLTESKDYESIANRLCQTHLIRALHGVIGLSTEIGELMDLIKKYMFYGKPIDIIKIEEELGDLFWYLSLIMDAMHINPYIVMEANIAKLKARYGDKFNEMGANERNLEKERDALEGARTEVSIKNI